MAKKLVPEDRKSLRTLDKLNLRSEGHAVVTARGADEALRSIGSKSSDLILSEIGPPRCTCIVKSSDTGEHRAKIQEHLDSATALANRQIRDVERRSSRDGTKGTDRRTR